MNSKRVIVIGGGASGLMAAGRAAEQGAEVTLLEKMDRPGKKILISGNMRCNVTNQKELDDFLLMYGENGRFLHGAFHRFFREDLLALLKRYGVETKTERGGRIFPVSDDAADVLRAFERYLAEYGVKLVRKVRVDDIRVEQGRTVGISTAQGEFPAEAVILAAGGASFPATGSSGDGYRLAAALGHTVTRLRPALVPLIAEERDLPASMQGVSLRNVRLTAFQSRAADIDPASVPSEDTGRGIPGKRPRFPVIESRLGEMMMTHFGIGGPVVLRMSLAIVDALDHGPVSVAIDLKPGLTVPQLRSRLQRDFDQFGKRTYANIIKGLLPLKMVEPFNQMSGVSPETPGNQVNAESRERLLLLLKALRFNIKGALPLAAAMVTAGGVSLKEIDPRTMASRLVPGLFFCGEVMDIDADTGGYNLQAAFSTGYVAGEHAALLVTGG
ncbi:MAG: NAD(P)/FAD-dependent oxidoreductase [Chloroflexi bacterium]|nr:NAD(P)/FAD-dependent oxidoreductase [Chloroflexota bacterium]